AESYEVSKDGLLYTFKLRKDIKFNTGNPVRAKDIKYSWERTVKGGVFIRYFQSVEGAQEYLDGKADGITGITTPDDFTVQVRMNSIYRPFLTYTASGALGVVEAAQVEKDKPEKRWMEGGGGGAGPYMIQSFDPNKLEAILVPNPYYFGEKPILQKITYVRVADPQTRQVMFEGGQADVAWANGLDLTVLSNSSNPLSKSLKMQPAHQTFFWPFRLNEPPFDDVKFREAFRYAIDLEGTISKIMPYNVALDAAGVSESPVWKGASCNIKQNPERAQKAFKESRYAGDASKVPAIRAYSTPGGDAVKYLQAVQEQVRKVLGVSMELKIADTIGDAERAKLHMTDHPAGRQDPWPGSLMDLMWWSKSQYRLAWTPYQNDEIDALIDKAHKATDDAEHLALYDQIHQKLCDQYLFLPGWYADTAILVKPYVKGINANEFNGHIWNLDKVWIAKH
ncbi:MAG: ABC transporter substrate-binding protein, partial [Chloroflexi bacterium]|nr:ABC transporter substrate-binding protein [Chloroflexota bacterium]